MAEVRSPFNFVPLNTKIFYPEWADLITQDIPFENGISGSIEMTINAKTPVFVRNGHSQEDMKAENDAYKSFSKFPDGRYFIPGSSVKGTVRSVLEILSMGKMHVDNKAMFAQPRLDQKVKMDMRKIRCGWLHRRPDDTYYISVCKGNPQRISLWEIDRMFGTHVLEEHFSGEKHFNLNKEILDNNVTYDPKTAAFKYHLLESTGENIDLEDLSFSPGEKNTYVYDKDGDFQGTIVLTSQPDKKKNWGCPNPKKSEGKWKEFIFPSEIDHDLELTEVLFNRYKSMYQDSPDWTFRMKKIDTTGMPVFLRENKNGLVDFGLTFMYKIPYTYVPDDLASKHERKAGKKEYFPDLAECIFGYISKEKALKGRVQFSHFVSDDAREDTECCLVLNGPKASFYPFYIRQNQGRNGFTNEYQNYNNGELSGRKRYILRDSIWQKQAESDKLNTWIHPLRAGSSFKGTIHFHNLLPEELGALLSALTFHGNESCYHQIGQAKPYGFGKVTFELSELQVPSYLESSLHEKNFYMARFEQMMQLFDPSWRVTNSLKEFFTLSSISVSGKDRNYQYMEMNMDKGENEFVNVKKAKLYLEDFTKRINQTITPESLLDKYRGEFERLEREVKERNAELERQERICRENERKTEEERKKKQENEELLQRKAQRSEAGLSVLEELRADGKGYKVTKFKQAKDRIEQWMKKDAKVEILPDEQIAQLWITLQRLYAEPDKKEKKDWNNFNSRLWQFLQSITSEELAKQWFKELTK